MTRPCLTPCSADGFSDSTFRAEVGTCPYFFFSSSNLLPPLFTISLPGSLQIAGFAHLSLWVFSAHLHSCPLCPLSIGAFRADASSLFLGFLSRL